MRKLKNKLMDLSGKSSFWNFLLKPVEKLYYFINFTLPSDEEFVKKKFKRIFEFELDLDNPKTLNAKIQWLKLRYNKTDLHTQCADKYESRKFIAEQVGEKYLTELLFQTTDSENLTLENLPQDGTHFIIKANHDSSGGIIVRDINEINIKSLQKRFKHLLSKNYYEYSKEYQYKNIIPRIVVEKLLENKQGKIPNDYKIHCFNGKAKIIYCSIDREGANTRNIYDIDWKPVPFTWINKYKDISKVRGADIPKPKNYDEMIEVAEKLASHFPYVRVDIFNNEGDIYVGELTFHHSGGFDVITPIEWDYKLGDMLKLPTV